MNSRKIGMEKEELACIFLKEQGFSIIETNFWIYGGEIDIIAKDGIYLVFVEVKYRKNNLYGGAFSAITEKKVQLISRCAMYYIKRRAIPPDSPMRFDVILIEGNSIHHIKNAFSFYSF